MVVLIGVLAGRGPDLFIQDDLLDPAERRPGIAATISHHPQVVAFGYAEVHRNGFLPGAGRGIYPQRPAAGTNVLARPEAPSATE